MCVPVTAMPIVIYLRQQAENCLNIARSCFDLASAEHMRLIANELKAKANEIERVEGVDTHVMGWGVRSTPKNKNS